jgi:hypothetical protein
LLSFPTAGVICGTMSVPANIKANMVLVMDVLRELYCLH